MQMSSENTIGETFSRLEEWYGLELHGNWPHIQPVSAVGNIALGLAITSRGATEELLSIREHLTRGSEMDQSLYEDDLTTAQKAFDLARARRGVFESLYHGINFSLHAPDLPTYAEAVNNALQHELKAQDKRRLPESMQAECAGLAREVCAFLDLESELHFTDLGRAQA